MTAFNLAACAGKEVFKDRKIAEQVAKRQRQNREVSNSVYRCHVCQQWHIGTRNPRPKTMPNL